MILVLIFNFLMALWHEASCNIFGTVKRMNHKNLTLSKFSENSRQEQVFV